MKTLHEKQTGITPNSVIDPQGPPVPLVYPSKQHSQASNNKHAMSGYNFKIKAAKVLG